MPRPVQYVTKKELEAFKREIKKMIKDSAKKPVITRKSKSKE